MDLAAAFCVAFWTRTLKLTVSLGYSSPSPMMSLVCFVTVLIGAIDGADAPAVADKTEPKIARA